MDQLNERRKITLQDLWGVLVDHLLSISLVGLICLVAMFVYSYMIQSPAYKSTATLYILRQENESNYVYTSSDFSLALNVVNDCNYMLKSHAVLDEVLSELELPMSYGTLAGCISTHNPDNSRVLEVTVKTGSADLSKKIVDRLCLVGADKISAAMGMDQINVYEFGTLEYKPCNKISPIFYVAAAFLGVLVSYSLFLLLFVLDDRVLTEDDVHKYLGLSVLGDIPNADRVSSSTQYKYGKYKKYSKYERYGDEQAASTKPQKSLNRKREKREG